MQSSPAFAIIKMALAALGVVSLWALRSLPWWFLALSSVSVSVLAINGAKSYRRAKSRGTP